LCLIIADPLITKIVSMFQFGKVHHLATWSIITILWRCRIPQLYITIFRRFENKRGTNRCLF